MPEVLAFLVIKVGLERRRVFCIARCFRGFDHLEELVGPRQRGVVFGLERDGAMFHLVGLT